MSFNLDDNSYSVRLQENNLEIIQTDEEKTGLDTLVQQLSNATSKLESEKLSKSDLTTLHTFVLSTEQKVEQSIRKNHSWFAGLFLFFNRRLGKLHTLSKLHTKIDQSLKKTAHEDGSRVITKTHLFDYANGLSLLSTDAERRVIAQEKFLEAIRPKATPQKAAKKETPKPITPQAPQESSEDEGTSKVRVSEAPAEELSFEKDLTETQEKEKVDVYFNSLFELNAIEEMVAIQKIGIRNSSGDTLLETLLKKPAQNEKERAKFEQTALQLLHGCPKEVLCSTKVVEYARQNNHQQFLQEFFQKYRATELSEEVAMCPTTLQYLAQKNQTDVLRDLFTTYGERTSKQAIQQFIQKDPLEDDEIHALKKLIPFSQGIANEKSLLERFNVHLEMDSLPQDLSDKTKIAYFLSDLDVQLLNLPDNQQLDTRKALVPFLHNLSKKGVEALLAIFEKKGGIEPKLKTAYQEIQSILPRISKASAFELAFMQTYESRTIQHLFSENVSYIPKIEEHPRWSALKESGKIVYISSEKLSSGTFKDVFSAALTTIKTAQVATSEFEPAAYYRLNKESTPEDRADFAKEMTLLQELQKKNNGIPHPNIMRLHLVRNLNVPNDEGALVEYCTGTFEKHAKKPPHTAKGILQVMSGLQGVGEGLQFLHSKGLAHLDLKPANAFMTRNNVGKLGDFGTALPLGTKAIPKTHVLSRKCYSTPRYTPPEFREETLGPMDLAKADVWAFGLTVCEAFMGEKKTPSLLKGIIEEADGGKRPVFKAQKAFEKEFRDNITKPLKALNKTPLTPEEQAEKAVLTFLTNVLKYKPAERPTMEQTLVLMNKTLRDLKLIVEEQ